MFPYFIRGLGSVNQAATEALPVGLFFFFTSPSSTREKGHCPDHPFDRGGLPNNTAYAHVDAKATSTISCNQLLTKWNLAGG